MTDASELVERLRRQADEFHDFNSQEAADTIEQLTARIAELEAEKAAQEALSGHILYSKRKEIVATAADEERDRIVTLARKRAGFAKEIAGDMVQTNALNQFADALSRNEHR